MSLSNRAFIRISPNNGESWYSWKELWYVILADGSQFDRYSNANIYRESTSTAIVLKSKNGRHPSFLVGGVLGSKWFLYYCYRSSVIPIYGEAGLVAVSFNENTYNEIVNPIGYIEGSANNFWVLYWSIEK